MDHLVDIEVFDNSNLCFSSLECKDYVKYLGVLVDDHFSWKHHIDYGALKNQ